MAGYGPSRGRAVDLDDIENWFAPRTADGPPGPLLGQRQLQRGPLLVGTARVPGVPPKAPLLTGTDTSRESGNANWLDRSVMAKSTGGLVARGLGVPFGMARGAGSMVTGIGGLLELANPLDAAFAPLGQTAWDRLFAGGSRALGYARHGVSNPQSVADDLGRGLRQFQARTDPDATAMAPTFGGEWNRNFDIGQNQGELLTDLVSTFYGGAVLKELSGLSALSKEALVAKYLEQGSSPKLAEYLAEPYPKSGKGHHGPFPQRFRVPNDVFGVPLPDTIAGRPLPAAVMDSPFNVLKPYRISRGEMYRLHYENDLKFHGARLPGSVGGGGWSGKRLGLKKNGPLGRAWYGTPAPLKAAVGGGTVGGTGLAYNYLDGGSR
jgi:hypothetical protein